MKKIVSYLTVLVVSLFTFVGFVNADIDVPDGKKVIYIGREGCAYCQAFVPGLENLSKKYNFEYKYVDTDKTSEEELSEWLKKLNVKEEEFGTPTFAVLINKELKQSHVGYLPEEDLFDFLQENGIIDEGVKYESPYKNIKFISSEEYYDLIKSNKKAFLVLSQSTNITGLKSRNTLEELAKELNIDVYFYNLGFTSQEEVDKFISSNEYIEQNADTLTLPTFMVIEGKKGIDATTNSTKDYLRSFIKRNMKMDCSLIVIICLSVLLAASIACNIVFILQNKKLKENK